MTQHYIPGRERITPSTDDSQMIPYICTYKGCPEWGLTLLFLYTKAKLIYLPTVEMP